MPRYFEFQKGSSDKFWEADLQGSAFVVRYGRRGTTGQTKRKEFASPEEARKIHDKGVAEKLREGYVEKSAAAAAEAAAPGLVVTYEVSLLLANGRRKTLKVTVGKDMAAPPYEQWEVKLPWEATSQLVEAIVADVNRRGPKAVGVAGRALNDSTLALLKGLRNLVDVTSLGKVGDPGLASIASHRTVHDVGMMFAEGTTDKGLAELATLDRLHHLEILIPGPYTDAGLGHLSSLRNLRQLTLGELNLVTDEGLKVLEQLPQLTEVSIRGAKLTKEAMDRLQRITKARKASKKVVPAVVPGELSPAVVEQLQRLGAKPVKAPKIPADAAAWPAPIRSLLYGYSWPRGKTFGNEESEDSEDCSVFSAEFDPGPFDFEEYEGCRGKSLALWGLGDGGNYLIVVAVDSSNPSDPDVRIIDHAAFSDPLPDEVAASKFLKSLDPETEDDG